MPRDISIEVSINTTRIIEIDLGLVGPPGPAGETADTIYVNPPTPLANYDIPFPLNPANKKKVAYHFGGTIAPGDPVVLALTQTPNVGDGIYQPLTPTSANGGDIFAWEYELATRLWRRIIY